MRNRPRPMQKAAGKLSSGIMQVSNQFRARGGNIGSRLFGYGAYTQVDAEKILASRVPDMHATLDRGVRIAHHEFLGDVTSNTAFTVTQYSLNPGINTTFPWLSSVAQAFQEYELNGCVFYFKSTSANALNSTNTALGQIIGAVQFNPYQPAPANKIEMLGLSGAADGKPSESNLYAVECKADMVVFRSKLIRTSAVSDDLAKYDHGNFYLGAAGSQANAIVGELHIVYDVLLKKPKLWNSGPSVGWYSHIASWTGVSNTTPLGVSNAIVKDNLGITTSGQTVTIPATVVTTGTRYEIQASWTGSGAVGVVPPVITCTNCTNVNTYWTWNNGVSYALISPQSGASASSATVRMVVQVIASNTPIVVSFGLAGTLPTGTPAMDLIITETL